MKEIIVSGYAYPFIRPDVLNQWLPVLTYLDSFSYGITSNGELIQLDDVGIIDAAKKVGVVPLMVVTPMDATGMFDENLVASLLSNTQSRKNLIENIRINIVSKELGGVDFDFEYVPVTVRDLYSSLVLEASSVLNPLGYIVTVALAPKTSANQPGLLYQGHDYGAMGYAANFVLLMTYEWGYTYGPPMAVSPINMMRKVLDYGVQEIPRNKILMGMPNYGYDWKLPFIQGTSEAEKISNGEASARAVRYGVTVKYDQLAQTPYYNYFDENGIEHQVWFDNDQSIRAKLDLINEYDIAGVEYWNIMEYPLSNRYILESNFIIIK